MLDQVLCFSALSLLNGSSPSLPSPLEEEVGSSFWPSPGPCPCCSSLPPLSSLLHPGGGYGYGAGETAEMVEIAEIAEMVEIAEVAKMAETVEMVEVTQTV